MNILIASDSPTLSTHLRSALALHGHECSISQVMPLEALAREDLGFLRSVELLLIALPRECDRAIMMIRRARRATAGRLVAVGAAEDPKHILDVLHAGADDYLDEAADPYEQLSQELARSAASTATSGHRGPVIAVAAASGGTGCTLVASSLSILLAQQAGDCGLLEFVSGYGDLAEIMNIAPRHTVFDLCRDIDGLDHTMLRQCFTAHPSGAQLLAAPLEQEDRECVTADSLERILRASAAVFPWTVVDTDIHTVRHSGIVEQSDLVVVVTRLDLSALCRTRRLLAELRGRDLEPERIVVVANRCGHRSEIPHGKILPVLGQDVSVWLPEDNNAALVAINCGNPVVLEYPRAPLSRGVAEISQEVLLRFTPAAATPGARTDARPLPPGDSGILRRAASVFF